MTNTNDPYLPNGIETPVDAPMVTPEQMFAAAAIVAIIIVLIHYTYTRAGSGIPQMAPGVANSVTPSMSVADIAFLIR